MDWSWDGVGVGVDAAQKQKIKMTWKMSSQWLSMANLEMESPNQALMGVPLHGIKEKKKHCLYDKDNVDEAGVDKGKLCPWHHS